MTSNETEIFDEYRSVGPRAQRGSADASRTAGGGEASLRAVYGSVKGASPSPDRRDETDGDELLRETGLGYRDLFHSAPVGLGLATPEGRVIACNPAMEALFGYTREEIKGLFLQDLYKDSTQRTKLIEVLGRKGAVSGFEVVLKQKDGTPFTASLTMAPLPVEGRTFLLTLLKNVSEKVRERETLQSTYQVLNTIFENAHMQIAYLDCAFSYIRVNGPYASHHQMSQDDLVGRSYFEFVQHHGHKEIFRRVLETGEPYVAIAQPFESGEALVGPATTYWDWSLVPIAEGDGPASGLILMLKDVSERVDAEQALSRSQEQLFQAQKMESLGILVAGVAHEINNPINQIIFNIPLLKRIWEDVEPLMKARAIEEPTRTYGGLSVEFLEENFSQLLDNMEMAANRIARIVQDLKSFSRCSSASEKKTVNINTAVDNAVRLAHSTVYKSGIDLSYDLADDLPHMKGNLPHLEQIVLNLLINAVEAMEGPGGRIRIRTRCLNGDLVLSVSDNGKGIPSGISKTVFDPFVTNRQGTGGTGLGLSVTQNLVRAHGAEIAFDTREGEGTTFTVTFPVAKNQTSSFSQSDSGWTGELSHDKE